MPDVLTFGESMMAFSPSGCGSLRYHFQYAAGFAGAESNTAIGLQKLGHKAQWVSQLGNDEPGAFILNRIRAEGVCTDAVFRDDSHPTGLMIKEYCADGDTRVYYYRDHSAFTHYSFERFPVSVLAQTKLFHVTGITPILSPSLGEVVKSIIYACMDYKIPVSFDPNIRLKLWKDRDFHQIISWCMEHSTYIMLGVNEASFLYGLDAPEAISEYLFSNFPSLRYLAIKAGEKGSYVCSRNSFCHIAPYPCHCIDSIGAGDAYNAGFLAGILEDKPLELCGKMANICGALCTQVQGDIEGIPDRDILMQHINSSFSPTR